MTTIKQVDDYLMYSSENLPETASIKSIGKFLLKKGGLGDRVYDVYERIAIATIMRHELEEAKVYIEKLSKAFPSSDRVLFLFGLSLEAQNRLDDAKHLYMSILEQDPLHMAASKRLITLKQNDNCSDSELIDSIKVYLTKFKCDQSAWCQLAELYRRKKEFDSQLYCLEELVLLAPTNVVYLAEYAKNLYDLKENKKSIGQTLSHSEYKENLVLARKYLCLCIFVNKPTTTDPKILNSLMECCLEIEKLLPANKSSAERAKNDKVMERVKKLLK